MTPKSMPFQIESDNELIGIDRLSYITFMKQCLRWCKMGKIYQFTIKEVTASEVQQNYYFASLAHCANSLGCTPISLESTIKKKIFEMAMNGSNEAFLKSDWIVEVVDITTSEVTYEIERFSKWTTSMLNAFLDVLEFIACDMMPGFKKLNPKEYSFEVRGKKRQLPFPELKMILKF